MSTGELARTVLVDVGAVADLDDTGRLFAAVDGTSVVVVRVPGPTRFAAFVATCPHLGWPLDAAEVVGSLVVCPQHGFRWNLRTGAPVPCWRGRHATGLRLVPVTVMAGRVLIGRPDGETRG